MFLCRRILFHLEFGTFRHTPASILPTTPTRSFATTLRANGHQRVRSRSDASLPTLSVSILQRLSAPSTQRSVDRTKRSDKITGRTSDLQAYNHLRTIDRPSLAALPLYSYFRLLKQASRLGHGGLINQLVQDILELLPESDHAPTVLAVMSSSTLSMVSPGMILTMLQCLHRTPTHLDALSLSHVTTLVATFAGAPPDPTDVSLVELITPLLLTHLQNLPQPHGHAVLTYTPPDIIRASFAFLDKLLALSQEQRVLDIFQILVNSGNIPSEVVQTISELSNFALIVRSSLVRACTHWHWRPLAGHLLSPLLKTSPSPPTISLTVDTIYACLTRPTAADLDACRSLIRQIHPFSPVPNGVVRQFYTVAEEIDAKKEAHALYSFTRSEEALETHRYPCPRGSSLPWLLRHLLNENTHHAKELGQEVLDKNIPIPLESWTHVVGGLAARGHGTLARALWSRFSVGKDRLQFIRDPSLMIRMVSLFHHLSKKEEDILKQRAGKGEFLDDELVRQRAEDFKGFLNLVLSGFAEAHSPMDQASHHILTSQARALFIVGEFMRGFETLKILLRRRELPDLYDVNVTLTVMAEHDPRTAAQLIKRMTDRGLEPDHVTFGTILHHALAHGDMELVDDMVNRAREMKNPKLSYKSIVSLVRGSVAFLPDFTQRTKLRSVFNIIKTLGRSTVVATPHLGRYLVYAALRASDPLMAYNFWDFLLKDNAPWDDREQVFQRRLIAKQLKKHMKGEWVQAEHAQVMLSQLQAQN